MYSKQTISPKGLSPPKHLYNLLLWDVPLQTPTGVKFCRRKTRKKEAAASQHSAKAKDFYQ